MAKETWGVLGVGEGRREEIRGMEKGLIAQKHRDAGRSSQLMQAGLQMASCGFGVECVNIITCIQ